jgi:NAD(P)-dependent dehydrogenase (short-subunit alcohol dehydrogenase family)
VTALRGVAALITGGGGGIGRACAEAFARDGAAVMLMGRTEATLAAARDRITDAVAATARVEYTVGDALSEASLDTAMNDAAALGERLAIAVSVVGGGTMRPLLAFDSNLFTAELQRNVVSAFLVIRRATPLLAAGGGGSIVCISSVTARLAYPFMTPYTAAKHAVDGLVRGAALELAPLQIRVNAVRAGLIRSDATRTHLRDNADVVRTHTDRPLGRAGEPTDVAAAVRYLAGPESAWVTGQSFAVDGGTELTKAPPYLEAVTRRRVGDAIVDAALQGSVGA